MRMGQGVRTGLGHGGITCVLQTQFSSYENDTNEVKGLYHDDCLEKRKKKNKIFCILNWGMAVSCSRNMNFVKCRVRETSEENFFYV